MLKIFRRSPKGFQKNKNFWKNITFFTSGVFILSAGIITIWFSSLQIPDFNTFDERKVINSTKIYDRTGEILLYDVNKDIRRTSIDFADMGINIKNATVAVEDSEFYNHSGIRIPSIIRATIIAKLTGKKLTGGSTITQQLIKNTLLTAETTMMKKVGRKIKEWVLALKMEQFFSKEKILELYLNEVPYGGTIYGIEEASRMYFRKKPADLTIAEAAYLASIPQSPTLLSPYGKNKDKLEDRKNYVLSRMRELKFISEEEYREAKNEIVVFIPQEFRSIKAPHFVFFIKEYLEEKYGAELVERGGLKVITTLDYTLQQKAEEFVREGALENEKFWDGKNAALVAIDPKTGQILSLVGSRDYFDKAVDGNYNVATAFRQPGSSFKPFIYATAFSKGFTDKTVLFDLPTEFQTTCDAFGKALPNHNQEDCYMPDNYDGKFRGPMSLRSALAESINVVAVKLFYLAGLSDSLKTAEEMGISTLTDINRYGLTLVIGGGEVSLLDMTSAYGVFANGGIRNTQTGILMVEDTRGKILEEYAPSPKEVLSKNSASIVSDILSDNAARTPTFGIGSPLHISGREVAVKTGTTNNNKDAWTIGYTPSIAVGVWAGNNDNQPMKKGGSAVAGPIWNKFLNEALKTLPDESFESPNLELDPKIVKPVLRGFWQGNENFFIDKISRKLATELTPRETLEEKVLTNVHSILYWIDKKNILGAPPASPQNDSQFNHFEIPIQTWWAQNRSKYPETTLADKPTALDDIHTNVTKPIVLIVEPDPKVNYSISQRIPLRMTITGPYLATKKDVFINDVYTGTSDMNSLFSFMPSEVENLSEQNEIKVIVYDSVYNKT